MSDDDGFLSRWSRRKAQLRQGDRPPDPEPATARKGPAPVPPARVAATALAPLDAAAVADSPPQVPAAPPPPPPTLDDVDRLPTDASDFSRFVARGVTPDVRNAALKKLFADPHFNVMDGLDIYIDDYGKPDPLPATMLRHLRQGSFLGLTSDDEPPDPAPPTAADAAHNPALPTPQAPPTPEPAAQALPHEDPDLRLQPNDATGRDGDPPGAVPPSGGTG